jgi:hypothetical protein
LLRAKLHLQKRDSNHLHYYYDPETGERSVKDKSSGDIYVSEKIGDALRNFMGW